MAEALCCWWRICTVVFLDNYSLTHSWASRCLLVMVLIYHVWGLCLLWFVCLFLLCVCVCVSMRIELRALLLCCILRPFVTLQNFLRAFVFNRSSFLPWKCNRKKLDSDLEVWRPSLASLHISVLSGLTLCTIRLKFHVPWQTVTTHFLYIINSHLMRTIWTTWSLLWSTCPSMPTSGSWLEGQTSKYPLWP